MEIAPSTSRFKLYDQFELLEFPDKYVVKPIESPEEGFSVNRRDGNIKPLDGNPLFILSSLPSLFWFQDKIWQEMI